jgi:hypothetical protein
MLTIDSVTSRDEARVGDREEIFIFYQFALFLLYVYITNKLNKDPLKNQKRIPLLVE